MKTSHYLLNFFLSLLLCLFAIALILTSVLPSAFLSKGTYLKTVEKYKISDTVYNAIQDVFIDQSGSTNIPPEVYENVIDKEEINEIFPKFIENVLDYTFGKIDKISQIEIDFTALENSLTSYFKETAKEYGMPLDENFEKQLDLTLSEVKESVMSFLDISVLKAVAEKARPYVSILKTACIVAAVIFGVLCLLFSLFLFLSAKDHGFFWISSSFACASLLVFLGFFLIRVSGFFNGFILKNEIFHSLITGFLKVITDKVLIVCAIVFVLSVIFLIVFVLKIKRQKCLQLN